jgi:hypothetical protein
MSCGCIYVDCEDSTEDIAEHTFVSTTKFKCDECWCDINIGQKYEWYYGYSTWSCANTFIHRTCETCLSIREEFFCDGWVWGGILDYVRNHIDDLDGEISSECLLRLTSKARQIVLEMIDEVWE